MSNFRYFKWFGSEPETGGWKEVEEKDIPTPSYRFPDTAYMRIYVGPVQELLINEQDKKPAVLDFDCLWRSFDTVVSHIKH